MAYSESDPWVGARNLGIPLSQLAQSNQELKSRGVAAQYVPVPGEWFAVPVAHSNRGRKDFVKAINGLDYDE